MASRASNEQPLDPSDATVGDNRGDAKSLGEGTFVMRCEKHEHQIGRFLDNELAPDARVEIAEHLETCSVCRRELANLQELTSGVSDCRDVSIPSDIWKSIERRLKTRADRPAERAVTGYRLRGSRRWALAASLVFVVGLGLLGLSSMNSSAKASTIDFGVLLDALPLDAQAAFHKFLTLYDARPGSPLDARKFAPSLDFETPPTLPGGFHLDTVYLLQFGNRPGVAASYVRDGEFLATIFHTPVKKEFFGTHKDYPCAVGKHHGHKVEVGSWKMVHLTDPSTCHCVLSQLDEALELPAVMAAVAPRAATAHTHEHQE